MMEGYLGRIIGQLTVKEIVKEPEMVGGRMRANCAADLNKMGLEVVSFMIREIRGERVHREHGRPDIGRVKKGCRRLLHGGGTPSSDPEKPGRTRSE